MLGFIPDALQATIDSALLLAIVYLALSLSRLRERIARIEGHENNVKAARRD